MISKFKLAKRDLTKNFRILKVAENCGELQKLREAAEAAEKMDIQSPPDALPPALVLALKKWV